MERRSIPYAWAAVATKVPLCFTQRGSHILKIRRPGKRPIAYVTDFVRNAYHLNNTLPSRTILLPQRIARS